MGQAHVQRWGINQFPHNLLDAGDTCSGPCSTGHGCSSNSKTLTEKIKKMHDDCHYLAPGYCDYHRARRCEALELIKQKGKLFSIFSVFCYIFHMYYKFYRVVHFPLSLFNSSRVFNFLLACILLFETQFS